MVCVCIKIKGQIGGVGSLFFHRMGTRNQTQVVRLDDLSLYPLNISVAHNMCCSKLRK